MSRHPARRTKAPEVAVADDRHRVTPARAPIVPTPKVSRISFRYSYTEISTRGPDVSVRHSQTRLEKGRLTRESFEGTLDASAYEGLVRGANAYVARQTAWLLKSLFGFLPTKRDDRTDRD